MLQSGDHACALYRSTAELIALVAAFIAEGVQQGERCWYVSRNAAQTQKLRTALTTHGVNLDAAVSRGQVAVRLAAAVYLVNGLFKPARTLRLYENAIHAALREGFAGFRTAADMAWAIGRTTAASRGANADTLITYEAALRPLFGPNKATGLCLFPRKRTRVFVVDGLLATHPVARLEDVFRVNPFYTPMRAGTSGWRQPRE